MMALRHEGKTALITGGASGIGRGCAERLSSEGANVMIADLADASAALGACEDNAGRVDAIRCDVTDEAAVTAAVEATVASFGSLDISVNNAGVIFVSSIVNSDVEQWRQLMDVNVIGVYLGTRAAARQMIDQGRGGVIVNASSGGGRHGVPYFAHYCASKAAVIMLTQSAALELATHKIRVNCYTPGHIRTPFWDKIAEGYAEVTGMTPDEAVIAFEGSVPWGRFGTPEDVAGAVAWLASDDAEYVSGQCLAMNGAELPW